MFTSTFVLREYKGLPKSNLDIRPYLHSFLVFKTKVLLFMSLILCNGSFIRIYFGFKFFETDYFSFHRLFAFFAGFLELILYTRDWLMCKCKRSTMLCTLSKEYLDQLLLFQLDIIKPLFSTIFINFQIRLIKREEKTCSRHDFFDQEGVSH